MGGRQRRAAGFRCACGARTKSRLPCSAVARLSSNPLKDVLTVASSLHLKESDTTQQYRVVSVIVISYYYESPNPAEKDDFVVLRSDYGERGNFRESTNSVSGYQKSASRTRIGEFHCRPCTILTQQTKRGQYLKRLGLPLASKTTYL